MASTAANASRTASSTLRTARKRSMNLPQAQHMTAVKTIAQLVGKMHNYYELIRKRYVFITFLIPFVPL